MYIIIRTIPNSNKKMVEKEATFRQLSHIYTWPLTFLA